MLCKRTVTTGYALSCDRCRQDQAGTHLSSAAALVAAQLAGWLLDAAHAPPEAAHTHVGDLCPACAQVVAAAEAEALRRRVEATQPPHTFDHSIG